MTSPSDRTDIPVEQILQRAQRDVSAALRYKVTLERLLSEGTKSQRPQAARGLALIAMEHPEEVHDLLGISVDAAINDVESVRGNASAIVAGLAKTNPRTVARYTDEIEKGLCDSHTTVVENTVETLAYVSAFAPRSVAPLISDLAGKLESDVPGIRRNVTIIMYYTADDRPEAVSRVVPKLMDRLAIDQNEVTRSAAAGALARVADHDGSRLSEHVESLVKILDGESNTTVQGNITAIFATLGDDCPELLVPHLGTLTDFLALRDRTTLVNTSEAISHVAKHDPDTVCDRNVKASLSRLWERTDDEQVRKNVAKTLRHVRERTEDQTDSSEIVDDSIGFPSQLFEEALEIGREATRQVILDVETFVSEQTNSSETTIEINDERSTGPDPELIKALDQVSELQSKAVDARVDRSEILAHVSRLQGVISNVNKVEGKELKNFAALQQALDNSSGGELSNQERDRLRQIAEQLEDELHIHLDSS